MSLAQWFVKLPAHFERARRSSNQSTQPVAQPVNVRERTIDAIFEELASQSMGAVCVSALRDSRLIVGQPDQKSDRPSFSRPSKLHGTCRRPNTLQNKHRLQDLCARDVGTQRLGDITAKRSFYTIPAIHLAESSYIGSREEMFSEIRQNFDKRYSSKGAVSSKVELKQALCQTDK